MFPFGDLGGGGGPCSTDSCKTQSREHFVVLENSSGARPEPKTLAWQIKQINGILNCRTLCRLM